jgi:hypothetical protein
LDFGSKRERAWAGYRELLQFRNGSGLKHKDSFGLWLSCRFVTTDHQQPVRRAGKNYNPSGI